MCDTFASILIAIPNYETNDTHNLWGLITPTTAYHAKYTVPFPYPMQPAFYPNTTAITDDAKNVIRAWAKAWHVAEKAGYAL